MAGTFSAQLRMSVAVLLWYNRLSNAASGGFYHICSLVIANGGPFDTLRMFSKSGEAMGYDGELWTAWLW